MEDLYKKRIIIIIKRIQHTSPYEYYNIGHFYDGDIFWGLKYTTEITENIVILMCENHFLTFR